MDTQVVKLLRYMQEHKRVTQKDAYFAPLYIGRLSARIYDLRMLGYEITTINKKGGAVYILEGLNE